MAEHHPWRVVVRKTKGSVALEAERICFAGPAENALAECHLNGSLQEIHHPQLLLAGFSCAAGCTCCDVFRSKGVPRDGCLSA